MKRVILTIIGCIIFSGTAEAMLAAVKEAITVGARRTSVRSVQTFACGSGVPWAEIPFTDTTDPEYQEKASEHKALAEIYSDPILGGGRLTIDPQALKRIIKSELGLKLSSDAEVYSWNAGKNITNEGGLDTAVVVSVQANPKGPAVVLTTPYSIAMMKRGESDVYGRTSIEIAHSLTPGDVLYASPLNTVIAKTSNDLSVFDLANRLEGMAWCFERSPTVKGVIRMTVPSLQEFAIAQYLNKLGIPAALAEPERELSEAWRIALIKETQSFDGDTSLRR